MSDITRDQVLHLARLAHLQLSTQEVKFYQKELALILKFIDQLRSVDVSHLPVTEQVTGLQNVMRPDQEKKRS